jgi:putative Ca2+/H+ antiporter (TMEM165/GDT1 family)
LNAFWLAFAMIFLAELGDKTQLVALTLSTCYNAKVVLWGIFWSTLAIHVFSAGIGRLMGGFLPTNWIEFAAGIAFIAFGFWTLRGDSLDDEEKSCDTKKHVSPFWLVFVTFFLAELGDKTMLSTVTLATTHPFIPVWIGSTLGMVLSDGLAILVGKILGAKLPERVIKIGASLIFFGFGIFSAIQGGLKLPYYAWIAGGISVLVLLYIFFHNQLPIASKKERPKVIEESAKEVAVTNDRNLRVETRG